MMDNDGLLVDNRLSSGHSMTSHLTRRWTWTWPRQQLTRERTVHSWPGFQSNRLGLYWQSTEKWGRSNTGRCGRDGQHLHHRHVSAGGGGGGRVQAASQPGVPAGGGAGVSGPGHPPLGSRLVGPWPPVPGLSPGHPQWWVSREYLMSYVYTWSVLQRDYSICLQLNYAWHVGPAAWKWFVVNFKPKFAGQMYLKGNKLKGENQPTIQRVYFVKT